MLILNLSQFGMRGVRVMSSLYRILHELYPKRICYRCNSYYHWNGDHCRRSGYKGDPRLEACDKEYELVDFVDENL